MHFGNERLENPAKVDRRRTGDLGRPFLGSTTLRGYMLLNMEGSLVRTTVIDRPRFTMSSYCTPLTTFAKLHPEEARRASIDAIVCTNGD